MSAAVRIFQRKQNQLDIKEDLSQMLLHIDKQGEKFHGTPPNPLAKDAEKPRHVFILSTTACEPGKSIVSLLA